MASWIKLEASSARPRDHGGDRRHTLANVGDTSTMQCPSCSQETEEQGVFCQHCGARLKYDAWEAEPAEAQTPAPPTDRPPADARERFQQAARSRQEDDVDQEHDVWEGSYSHLAMVGWWIAAAVVTVAAIIAAVLFLADYWLWVLLLLAVGWLILGGWYAYRRYSVHYYLTSQRFIHEHGILWRTTDRIELIDVDDVTFRQGPIERMFGVGTIHLSSSDKTHPEIDLPGIEAVQQVASSIDDLRRRERRQRGLHIEAV